MTVGIEPTNPRDYGLNVARLTTSLNHQQKKPSISIFHLEAHSFSTQKKKKSTTTKQRQSAREEKRPRPQQKPSSSFFRPSFFTFSLSLSLVPTNQTTKQRKMSLSSSSAAPVIDEALYSRQLYVIDHASMLKVMETNVLLIGLGGLGVEIGLFSFSFFLFSPTFFSFFLFLFSQGRDPFWSPFRHTF